MNTIDMMNNRININTVFKPKELTKNQNLASNSSAKNEDNFSYALAQKILEKNGITYTKHSQQRANERNIKLNVEQAQRLVNAVANANSKGIKEGLVVIDNMSMVMNIPQRIIITTAENNNLKQSVFTNIDGAIIG